jgi:hypothetical protein
MSSEQTIIAESTYARIEAEKLLLAGLLVLGADDSQQSITKVGEFIIPEDFSDFGFSDNRHSRIYAAMLKVEKTDQLSVAKQLNSDGDLKQGDVAYLSELVSLCEGIDCISYAKALREFIDHPQEPAGALPEVEVSGRQLRDISADVLAALYRANKPERIFRRSGSLTRVSLDEKQRPYTETLGESAFRGYLARSCNFVRITPKGVPVAVPPPIDVVRDCLTLGDWQFPALLGITETPVIRPDGTVMNRPGYDSITDLYYYPSSRLKVPPIPDEPTESDIKAAIELAADPLADFPFDGNASRANAIATMFTPILRPMIDGPVPLALFDKPQQGTGASLLAEVISLVATGRPAAMMTAQKDDEGWRKAITSLLLKGQLVVTIDNIEYDLWTPSLASILTATTYQDRILGRSEMVILPNRTTWIATGNNIRLRGDLPRRCIWIRMDAQTARPWLRDLKKFRHPHLIEWVCEKRGDILAAILTVARAWVVAGRPEAEGLPNLGGYESYCRIVGGVLGFMGVEGFLANLGAMYDETDNETPQWEGFLETWQNLIGEQPITAAELISQLKENDELRAALPDTIGDTEVRNYSRKLGNSLAKRNGVRFPSGLMISKGSVKHHAITWQVGSYRVRYEDVTPQAKLALGGELGESENTPAHVREEISYIKGVEINSPDSPLASNGQNLTPPDNDLPEYPTKPYYICGGKDYWLREATAGGPAMWLCSRCHPPIKREVKASEEVDK